MPQMPQMVAGNSSVCLGMDSMQIRCNSSDGFSSKGHTVTQMVLDSARVSSDDSVLPLGKADRVDTAILWVFSWQQPFIE